MKRKIITMVTLTLASIVLLLLGIFTENPLYILGNIFHTHQLYAIIIPALMVVMLVLIITLGSSTKFKKIKSVCNGATFRLIPAITVKDGKKRALEVQLETLLNMLKEQKISYCISAIYKGRDDSMELMLTIWDHREQAVEVVKSLSKVICREWIIEEVDVRKNENDMACQAAMLTTLNSASLRRGLRSLLVKHTRGIKFSSDFIINLFVNLSLALPLTISQNILKMCNDETTTHIPLSGFKLVHPFTSNTIIKLRKDQLLRHIGIFGTTGSGKSTTAALLVNNIYRSLMIPIIILDWHDEYEHLFDRLGVNTKSVYVFNFRDLPLNPLYNLEKRTIDTIVDIFTVTLELTGPQSYYLQSALEYILRNRMKPTISNLQHVLKEEIYEGTYSGREALYALLRKISILTRGFNCINDVHVGHQVENVLFKKGIHVIRLAEIRNIMMRRLYAILLIRLIYEKLTNIGLTNNPRAIIVVEEAHNIFSKEGTFPSTLIPEVRKYGLGFIIITQSMSTLPQQVILNVNSKIIHTLISNCDIRLLSEIYNINKDYVRELSKLTLGEAYLFLAGLPHPLKVYITI